MTVTSIEARVSPSLAGPAAVEPHRSALIAALEAELVARYPGVRVVVGWLAAEYDDGSTRVLTGVERDADPHPSGHVAGICERVLWSIRTPVDGVHSPTPIAASWLATLPYDHAPGVLVPVASRDDAREHAVEAFVGDGMMMDIAQVMDIRAIDDDEADALRAASGVRRTTVIELAEAMYGRRIHPRDASYIIPSEALAA